ncbi:MAG: hypothetical protein KAZ88_04490 [Acidimicrobiia bacterium]|nr:hypothetical protein [Acidimicrobiia bacterium]MBP8180231.1 hypothetical protein [Acidimicrobiia bacterium]
MSPEYEPGFIALQGPITSRGPLLTVRIAMSASEQAACEQAGTPIGRPIHCRAVIDTASPRTQVRPEYAERLGLHPHGLVAVHTADGQGFAAQVMIELGLGAPAKEFFFELPVLAGFAGDDDVGARIGMDVLSRARLCIEGEDRRFSLEF